MLKKIIGAATLAVGVLCVVVYGKGLLGLGGTFALASQCISFGIVLASTYLFAFGLRHEEEIVLSAGLTTRDIGAAMAPLLAAPEADQQALIMVVLGLPLMVVFTRLGLKWSGIARAPATSRALAHDGGKTPVRRCADRRLLGDHGQGPHRRRGRECTDDAKAASSRATGTYSSPPIWPPMPAP